MNKIVSWLSLFGIAVGTIGCASTTWNGYSAGTVKYSEISYNYTAKPALKNSANMTYKIRTDAALNNIRSIPALEKKGIHMASTDADVSINVKSGEITHEPGGFGIKSYKPAVFSTMPIKIEVFDRDGNEILVKDVKHQEILTVDGAREYSTREEAKAAMTVITEMARSSADAKVKSGAPSTVNSNLNALSKELFEPREVSVVLPALRSSGNVDMETAYTLLAKAKSDEQVKAALAAYVALGVDHNKTDGTYDSLGNYGVYCGLASAKILCGDLAGAWDDTKQAWKLFPDGKEYKMIAKVLRQQEKQTGTAIVNQDIYDDMTKESAGTMGSEMLKNLFKGGH